MDAPFSMMVSPEIGYDDIVKIAVFSHVAEAGINVRFEINRDSSVSAFNAGLSADSIIELLQRLSRNRVDENLEYALRDWEKSHREVTIHRGVVLTLSPERRYLAETRPLSTMITETLAPGIYVIPATLEDRAVRALHKAGVGIVARRGGHEDENRFQDSGKPVDGFSGGFFPPLRSQAPPGAFPQEIGQNGPGENFMASAATEATDADGKAFDLMASFHSTLNKMRADKEKHDELAARIDRRLILCESQLSDAAPRYEKLEAHGLDYSGKTLIAKQAIALQSVVEVTWTANHKQERVLGIPRTLEKNGSESTLVLRPMNPATASASAMKSGDETIRVPLGKISLLRRIKKSIFETTIG
jgi:hypothetical protein